MRVCLLHFSFRCLPDVCLPQTDSWSITMSSIDRCDRLTQSCTDRKHSALSSALIWSWFILLQLLLRLWFFIRNRIGWFRIGSKGQLNRLSVRAQMTYLVSLMIFFHHCLGVMSFAVKWHFGVIDGILVLLLRFLVSLMGFLVLEMNLVSLMGCLVLEMMIIMSITGKNQAVNK